MSSRIGWSVVAGLGYAVTLIALYAGLAGRESGAGWRWAHALAYAVVGVALLGALARQLPRAQPHVWRVLALVVGAGAAGLGLWLSQPALRAPASIDAWMAALLGLAIAAILPRWLPAPLTRRWLGIERRQAPRD
jgi:hypothetical protein